MCTNADDRRRMNLVVADIPGIFKGKPLFIDATCVSPIHGNGRAMPQAGDHDGAVTDRKDQETREKDYPDVEAHPSAQLLSLSVETYGRWGQQSLRLVRELSKFKGQNNSNALRTSVSQSYAKRWWTLLSVALQKYLADTLLQESGEDLPSATSD